MSPTMDVYIVNQRLCPSSLAHFAMYNLITVGFACVLNNILFPFVLHSESRQFHKAMPRYSGLFRKPRLLDAGQTNWFVHDALVSMPWTACLTTIPREVLSNFSWWIYLCNNIRSCMSDLTPVKSIFTSLCSFTTLYFKRTFRQTRRHLFWTLCIRIWFASVRPL